MPNRDFYLAWCVRKISLYGDVINSFDRKSDREHDGMFKMGDSVPSARYSSFCNVLRL